MGHAVTVDVEMLGDDLTIGKERTTGWDLQETLTRLDELLDRHRVREARLRDARSVGARGWIDGAAQRVLDMSGLSRADVIERLSSRPRIEFAFRTSEGSELDATLLWLDGTIVAHCHNSDGGWSFEVDCLTMPHSGLPDTVLNSWVDRDIGSIIDQPIVPTEAIVTGLPDAPPKWLFVSLAIPSSPIDVVADAPN